jgi:hypothetical protein
VSRRGSRATTTHNVLPVPIGKEKVNIPKLQTTLICLNLRPYLLPYSSYDCFRLTCFVVTNRKSQELGDEVGSKKADDSLQMSSHHVSAYLGDIDTNVYVPVTWTISYV